MSKTTLVIFWSIWLLDVLIALFGHREFITGVFGRYAAPNSRYIWLWVGLMAAMLFIICGSIYLKNHGNPKVALSIVCIPMVLALPYVLWFGVVLLGGKNIRWN